MFNRYWRSYPWGLRLALAMLLVFTLYSFSTYLILILGPKVSGVPFSELIRVTIKSSPAIIRDSLIIQGLLSLGMFALPAALFAIFTHPRPRTFLGLRAPGKGLHWLLVTLMFAGLIPALLVGQAWMSAHISLGAGADKEQAANTATVEAWMSMRGGGALAMMLVVMAVIPAIGEELLFRGVFLRLFHQFFKKRRSLMALSGTETIQPDVQRSMLAPVLITSLMFAYVHAAPYSYLFIFIAGCVLALVYQLTGSLLCSIWAHLLYNGSQIVMSYYNVLGKETDVPAWTGLAGLGLFLLCFYGLIRTQTPLRADWSADFAPGEDAADAK